MNKQNILKQRPMSHVIVHSMLKRIENGIVTNYSFGRIMKGKTRFSNLENPDEAAKRPQTTQFTHHFQFTQDILESNNETNQLLKKKSFTKPQTASMSRSHCKYEKKLPPDDTLIESLVFPSIYFAKIFYPENVKPLPPEDERTPMIYQILQKLFHEIRFNQMNILVCQNKITTNFVIFFSDAELIPFSKCCNAPVYIEMAGNGEGKILCNAVECGLNLLTEFIINFDDSQKLWKDAANNKQDKIAKSQVSKLIISGQFKHKNLPFEFKKHSKDHAIIFSKKSSYYVNGLQQSRTDFNQFSDEFMQGPQSNRHQQKPPNNQYYQQMSDVEEGIGQAVGGRNETQNGNLLFSNNVNQHRNLTSYQQYQKKISKGLVYSSKVFNKDFDQELAGNQHLQAKKELQDKLKLRLFTAQQPKIYLKSSPQATKQKILSAHTYSHKQDVKQMNNNFIEDENTLLDIKNMINEILA